MSYAPSHDSNTGGQPVRPSSVSIDALGIASLGAKPRSEPRHTLSQDGRVTFSAACQVLRS